MKADVKKDGKLFLAEVSDKLRDRLTKLAETLLAGQQEIENMHAYYWENYTEMDQYGYEDFDNQQALLHQINANNESQLLYQRFQKMADAPFFGRVDFLYDGDEEADPFVPTVRDGKVYARGSADNKSPLMAHLKALEYFIRRKMEVPVNVIFVFEGDEECGSRGLEEFLAEHRTELAADLVFFSDGPKDPSGLPIIALGAKGDLSIHITVETMNRNVHARYAPVLPSAAWQLVEILGKCRSKDKILIPGFEEGILPFTKKEIEIMDKLPKSEDSLNTIYEAKSSNYGKDFYPRLLGQPTFNICWIKTGANGVVPAKAEALIDCRLVPDQDPEKVFQCIKRHVEMMGYDNVKIENDGYIPSSKTDVNTPYLPAVEEICRDIYGEYVIYPCRPSSAPDYLWTNVLKLPAIQVRWSDADSDNHAPNEHLSIKEYMDGIALTVCALQAVSEISEINEKD